MLPVEKCQCMICPPTGLYIYAFFSGSIPWSRYHHKHLINYSFGHAQILQKNWSRSDHNFLSSLWDKRTKNRKTKEKNSTSVLRQKITQWSTSLEQRQREFAETRDKLAVNDAHQHHITSNDQCALQHNGNCFINILHCNTSEMLLTAASTKCRKITDLHALKFY